LDWIQQGNFALPFSLLPLSFKTERHNLSLFVVVVFCVDNFSSLVNENLDQHAASVWLENPAKV
jgi:hypothetical protein